MAKILLHSGGGVAKITTQDPVFDTRCWREEVEGGTPPENRWPGFSKTWA
jgi:hypothetical protein